MQEVFISKRILLVVLLLLGLGIAGLWGIPRLLRPAGEVVATPLPLPSPQEPPSDDAAAQAAVLAGAQAFYTVDYQMGQQAWLDRLCAVSTETGCVVYQNLIAPSLWPAFEGAETRTTVQVSVEEKVQEEIASTRGNAPMQVWRLAVELSAPWPVQKSPETTFSTLALVIEEQGVWKFERFLTEEEMRIFAEGK